MSKNLVQTIQANQVAKTTLQSIASQGIFHDCGEEQMTLEQILNILEENTVTIETFDTFSICKNFESFSWRTYRTRDSIDRLGRLVESETILVLQESEDDEDFQCTQTKFEITLSNIESFQFTIFEQMLWIYMENGVEIRLSYI